MRLMLVLLCHLALMGCVAHTMHVSVPISALCTP
jgi:hypothetical protein